MLSIPDCLDQGIALLNEGRLSEAIACYQRKLEEAPGHIAILNNLANALQVAGRFVEANRIYLTLLHSAKKPLALRIASNYLAGLQYQQEYDAPTLKAMTAALGAQFAVPDEWSFSEISRPIRVGFVSADLCDHPVGFFLLPLLANLDRCRFTPILYSAGSREDQTAHKLKEFAEWHDIASLDHGALLSYLRAADLNVLVDLSGHTAGNRLPVFARRAAPIQVSWLGYFATTGIPVIDAVIMDSWHAPIGAEAQFTERVVRMPQSRFCYAPVSFAPEVSPPPSLRRGFITFGSFNNTAKFNDHVFSVWAKILHSVPNSRLVLKWPTFSDDRYAQSVRVFFAGHGVGESRIELRGRSFHVDLLKEYADIDIALDPFPFTGGHTSCEALWMGLPIITLPGKRPVSRQTLCFLANIGLEEFVAEDELDYVSKAVALAAQPGLLQGLRNTMRSRMQASPLMDAKQFARDFENILFDLAATPARHIEST